MKNVISNIFAFLWFFGVLIWMLLLMPFVVLVYPSSLSVIIKSGFAGSTTGFAFIGVFSFFFGITLLVPAFRKCLKKLPWIYPYYILLFADIFILSIGEEILNFGYQVQNDIRHAIFIALVAVEIIVGRLIMCIYFHKKKLNGGSRNE